MRKCRKEKVVMSFGANLEMIRRKFGIQLYKLESYCGIPQQRLKDFESGTANPTLTEVLALSYVFSTTPQALLGMVDKRNVDPPPAQNQVSQKAENINANQMQTSNTQVQTQNHAQAIKKSSPKASQTATKGHGKRNAHKNADWKVDDVTEALQQLQVGSQEVKNADVKSQQMDPEKLKQQAIAHASTASKNGVQNVNQKEAKQPVEKQPANQTTEVKSVEKKQQPNNKAQCNPKEFGEKMKNARIKLNLSYTKICKQLGIRTLEYVQIETGAVQPNAELKAKICELLGIS